MANALNQNAIATTIFPAAPKIATPHLPWPWGVSIYTRNQLRMKINSIILFILGAFLLLTSCVLIRQKDYEQTLFPENQEFLKGFVETIKFKYDKWIYINASIDKSQPKEFLLDTGSPCILRFNERKTLSTKSKKLARLGSVKVDYTSTNLRIGRLHFKDIGFMVMDFGDFPSMVGVNLMSPYIWQFNFKDSSVSITDNIQNLRIDTSNAISFKPFSEQEIPVVQLVLNGKDTIEAFIDTGFPGFCKLNGDVDISNFSESTAISKYNNCWDKKLKKKECSIYSDHILLNSFKIGHVNLKNQVVIRDRNYIGKNLLGLAFLRKFKSTIDWNQHLLYLSQQEDFKNNSARYSYGLDWYRWKGDVIATWINNGSSAEKNGIKTGWRIEAINGVSTAELNDKDISDRLTVDKANQEVSIKFLEQEEELKLLSSNIFTN